MIPSDQVYVLRMSCAWCWSVQTPIFFLFVSSLGMPSTITQLTHSHSITEKRCSDLLVRTVAIVLACAMEIEVLYWIFSSSDRRARTQARICISNMLWTVPKHRHAIDRQSENPGILGNPGESRGSKCPNPSDATRDQQWPRRRLPWVLVMGHYWC